MNFVRYLVGWLLGCRHPRTGWPITLRRENRRETYVVCLDCGAELTYRGGLKT